MILVFRLILLLIAMVSIAASTLQASDWVGGVDGNNFNNADNWLPAAVPGASDDAYISNGGTVNEAGVNSLLSLWVMPGILNVNSGGTLTVNSASQTRVGDAWIGGGTTGVINMNVGGTLVTPVIANYGNVNTGIVNINGGTLQANYGTLAARTDFLQGTTNLIGSNGATINVNTNVGIDISTPLLAATGSTGGLTKAGSGYLWLTGTTSNTYTGTTVLSSGRLYLYKTSGAVAIPGNLSFANGNWVIAVGNGQIAPTSVINFTTGTGSVKNLIFNGTTEQTVGGLISNGTPNVKISAYDSANAIIFPAAYDTLRFTINTASGTNYSYKGTLTDNANGFVGLPMLCIIKDGPGTQVLEDRGGSATIGGTTSGGLEVKNGVLNCVGATLPDCQNILDIVPSGPHAGEASNAGHYTISGGTLMIGTKNAGATSNRGIGQFKITGGMVDADATTPGTIYSNHDFDIQGGTVNAVLAGTGHEQGTTTLLTQGLNKTSDSLATLGAANLYTGPTTISAGTLALSEKGQISMSSPISTATDATFEILAGTHAVGTISGTGTTIVLDGATLTATSIVQDTLVIGGTGGAALAAVPEPGTLVLAAMGLIGLLFAAKKRRS